MEIRRNILGRIKNKKKVMDQKQRRLIAEFLGTEVCKQKRRIGLLKWLEIYVSSLLEI